MKSNYEVLIVGAGPAGLSAGLALGRLLRTVLIADDGRPRNSASSHLNNFIGRDGIHPGEWRQEARRDLQKYETIELLQGSVDAVEKVEKGFHARFSNGQAAQFKKVILAYGILDRLPDIPGLPELWGKAAFHCPYCHGFEVRGKALGIIGSGHFLMHMLPLFYGLSKDLILFTNGDPQFSEEQKALFRKRNIEVIEEKVENLIYREDELKGVVLENGEKRMREGLFITPILPFRMKSSIGESLGCEKTEMGLYKVGERNETTVKGVFAAGDNMSMVHSVIHAAANGTTAGAQATWDLLNEVLNS